MILNLVAAGFAILPIFSVPSEIEKAINPLYKRYNNDKYCKSDTEKFRKLNPEGQTKSEKVPHISLI